MIERSESWNDFLEQMKEIGYTFPRSGYNEKGEYLTFCAPGNHRKRSDTLGSGYTVADIKKRILGEHIKPDIEAKRPPWIKQGKDETGVTCNPCAVRLSKKIYTGNVSSSYLLCKTKSIPCESGKSKEGYATA